MRRVTGIDLSLTSTGIAVITETSRGTRLVTSVVKPDVATHYPGEHLALYELRRIDDIVNQLMKSSHRSELVMIESPAYASKMGKSTERAALYYFTLGSLALRRQVFDTMPPTSLKKQITGSGRSDKDSMIQSIRSAWGDSGWSEEPKSGIADRADAAGLAWVAAKMAGFRDLPPLAQ